MSPPCVNVPRVLYNAQRTPSQSQGVGNSHTVTLDMSQYWREFGFILEDRSILVDDVRVRATGRSADQPKVVPTPPVPGANPIQWHSFVGFSSRTRGITYAVYLTLFPFLEYVMLQMF